MRALAGGAFLALGGCAQVSVPLASADVRTPLVISGHLGGAQDTAFADIDPIDRQMIAATLSGMISTGPETGYRAADAPSSGWINPESGNSGTISKVGTQTLASTGCLTFTTTANTIEGVRLYQGSACQNASSQLTVTALRSAET
ncbi:RT0821/Lpp0805 family surface protein [Roseibium sp. RKSG952]|uniref:RT0821/Lpp0805 family surface protein n=1 Tax=Roseibium sp. RKSG952 TaxID=2529384 RepID=UPI001AD8A1DA|nr:RT0821/Lpp0805 family surface protein [Roseibium sp. RKSG952]